MGVRGNKEDISFKPLHDDNCSYIIQLKYFLNAPTLKYQ